MDESVSSDEEVKGLEILEQSISHQAMKSAFTSRFRPILVRHKDVLEQIMTSMDEAAPQTNRILWVYGESEIQATALAQALVDRWRASEKLGASFFFQHGVEREVGRLQLFPTIAYQLANNVPDFRKHIGDVLSRGTDFLSMTIDEQYQSLLVGPLQQCVLANTAYYNIVIAGLDACEGPEGTQAFILRSLADLTKRFSPPFRILVTSRPTCEICQAIGSDVLTEVTQRISLPRLDSVITHSPSYTSEARESTTIPKWARSKPKPPFCFPSYPRIVTLQRRNGHAESYCRSLLLSGNGFPIWQPSGDFGMPSEVLEKGVSIGDVGTIDKEGSFRYYFNIFYPADHPLNANFTPREFQPISPSLQPDEVVCEPEHFKPGHVVTSEGVNVIRHTEDPLDISFSSDEPEGAILVLPSGASRRDLISTTRFHEYVRKNAPHWYQYINDYAGLTEVNGSLFLVTGCDKANDWAVASFPFRAGNTSRKLDLRYTWKPEHRSPWRDPGTADTNFYGRPQESVNPKGVKNQCVFVRGLRISLTQRSWLRTLPYPEHGRLHYSLVLQTPSKLHHWLNSILVFLRLRLSEKQAANKLFAPTQHLFHPNYIIGQALLAEYPYAEIAVVEDAVWCSLVHGKLCTLQELNGLVTEVFDTHRIVEKDGIVSLLPKTQGIGEKVQSLVTPTLAWPQRRSKKPVQWTKSIPVSKYAKVF